MHLHLWVWVHGMEVISEIRLATWKLGDGYVWTHYSFLEICSPIKIGGRSHSSLCLSGRMMRMITSGNIIITIATTIIITYHVPSQCAKSTISNSTPGTLYHSF